MAETGNIQLFMLLYTRTHVIRVY